jgi:hypothetical protein
MLFFNNQPLKVDKGYLPSTNVSPQNPIMLKLDDRFSEVVNEVEIIGATPRQYRRYSSMTVEPAYQQNILDKGYGDFRYAVSKSGTELSPVYKPDGITISDGFYAIKSQEELFWWINHPNYDDSAGLYTNYTKGVERRQPMFSIFDKDRIEKAKNERRKQKMQLEQTIYNTDLKTLDNYYLVHTKQDTSFITGGDDAKKAFLENFFVEYMNESELKYSQIVNLFSKPAETMELIIDRGFAHKVLTISNRERMVQLNGKNIFELPQNSLTQRAAKPLLKAYFEEMGQSDFVTLKDSLPTD